MKDLSLMSPMMKYLESVSDDASYCDPEAAIRERLEHRDWERGMEECHRRRASRVYSKMMSLVGKGKGNLK